MTRFRDTFPAGARAFETRLQVQWADIDIAGIMYFAAYWRFAEYAEIGLFSELGFPYDRVFDEFDIWIPRVRAEAEYHAPALMNDWLRLRTHLEKVGASSIAWKTVAFNERTGEAGAEFRLTAACMSRTTKKSCPLPEPLRDALKRCLP
ncbi:MAG TPA: thioesterase family protein [Candidatus Baltobacteraceae bacterium]|nr:thioesterase family protein [Candidatus Baltobacteraceae bacterium]